MMANIQGFTQFVEQVKQTGKNPQQIVQELMNSGKMSQAQFNELAQKANAIMGGKMF